MSPTPFPKIIMQTWKNTTIPEKWKTSPPSIAKYMPDWQYVLMTDADNRAFVAEYFPNFLPYFDNFEFDIQRADAIRYMWLYVNGGIYLDLDYELQGNLEPALKTSKRVGLVTSGNLKSWYTNSLMVSMPGEQLWLDVIEEMKKPLPYWVRGKHMIVQNSTGPMMLSRVSTQKNYNVEKLPQKLLNPCKVCDDFETCAVGALIKPLQGCSWHDVDSKIYNFFLCNWIVILIVFLILILIWFLLCHRCPYRDNHQTSY